MSVIRTRLRSTILSPAAWRLSSPSCTPCTCHFPPTSSSNRPFATSSPSSAAKLPTPPKDKLVLAAQHLLNAATEGGNRKKKEHEELSNALRDVVDGEDLVETLTTLAETEEDAELRELALLDLPTAEETLSSLRRTLLHHVTPPAPTSSLSALIEIKAGVGGSEAALFAAALVRMYTRLSVRKGWKASVVESVGVGVGMGAGDAFREAILEVTGEGAFGVLRHEAGVHRVQRVPATETQGRVHTSTVGVVVLPAEAENAPVEDDLFEQKDVKVEVMRSRGAGGQHVNKTESAIRLTHTPTGITVSMQDSRSQHENRTKAYRVLRARLLDRKLSLEVVARRSARRNQVKGADRSEKVRTYNFPQDRVTDHRVPVTVSGLEGVMEGGETLDYIARELEIKEEEENLEGILEGEAL